MPAFSPLGALIVAGGLGILLLAAAAILLNVPPLAVVAGVAILLWMLGRVIRKRRARSGPSD
jgi:hypothetical protein